MGYGDEIMITGYARILKQKYPPPLMLSKHVFIVPVGKWLIVKQPIATNISKSLVGK